MKKASIKETTQLPLSAFVLSMAVGSSALAQQAAAPAQTQQQARVLQDIIVTARKVEENLQDVPVAVTAFSGKALEQQNAVKLSDVSGITPGLRINSADFQGPFSLFMLRGQINTTQIATADPSVGVYVDGVYWARSYGINANLLDVKSVQTLKGPQGTLFGRNTTGGAVLIDTNDPDLNNQSGELSGTYGRFNYRSGRAILNLPLIDGRLAFRAAYERLHDDGYAPNVSHAGQKQGQRDGETARFKLRAQVTDDLTAQLSAELWDADYRGIPPQLLYVTPGSSSELEAGAETLGTSACFVNVAACRLTGRSALDQVIQNYSGKGLTVSNNVAGRINAKTQTYVGTISYDTSFGNAKIIGGWRKVHGSSSSDFDGSPFTLLDFQNAYQNLEQWSLEGTLTGKTLSDKLSFAVGAFYFKEIGIDSTVVQLLPRLVTKGPAFNGDIDNKSVGIYGQGTYELTDKLSFTGGLRWSRDDKGVTINNGQALSNLDGIIPGSFTCTVTTGCPSFRSGTFSGVSYTAGFDYRFAPDVMAYVKTSRAFRSGGVNLRDTAIVPGYPASFRPEKATNYEVGVKSEFLDRRLRVNVAAYYTIVDDVQRTYTVTVPGTTSTTTIASNAGRADFYGGEVEVQALVVDGVDDQVWLGVSGANINTKYVDYLDPNNNNFDRSGERFAYVPKGQFTLSGTYTHQFDASELSLHTDYVWESSYALDPYNYYVDANGVPHSSTDNSVIQSVAVAQALKDATTKPAGGVLNARATYRFGKNKRFELAVWGVNILNNRDVVFPEEVIALYVAGQRRAPATYGVTGTISF
ncbi:MAG TPA: TonB-dependent receptor [Phenylobacterium sp.]|uniref:TonB-dependent receptor n=1 Tax=Phenylobacterium sp. TaxID=1871053 RepID=UPI002B48A503|nr:TonB-dependent receptor [Phenylobacterium sp.]HKR90536.1 TonB-dependent receptor [Phenylobacterium sp.]